MSNRVAEAYTMITGSSSSAGNNTMVAAPGSGRRIVWRKIKLVNGSANAMTCIIKYGATSKMTSIFDAQIGAGEVYYEEEGKALPENTALINNMSGSTLASWDVDYLTESI